MFPTPRRICQVDWELPASLIDVSGITFQDGVLFAAFSLDKKITFSLRKMVRKISLSISKIHAVFIVVLYRVVGKLYITRLSNRV